MLVFGRESIQHSFEGQELELAVMCQSMFTNTAHIGSASIYSEIWKYIERRGGRAGEAESVSEARSLSLKLEFLKSPVR